MVQRGELRFALPRGFRPNTRFVILLRRPELFAEPAALRAAVSLYAPADFSDLILKWLTALHFKGFTPVESCIRVLFEELQLEDCGWCIRTDRGGRIDFDRTIKAMESGYDLDLRDAIPGPVRSDLSEKLQRGELAEIAVSFGEYIRSRIARIRPREGDTLPASLWPDP